jgi:RNA polymerase sigma factor (sigma-70 family)
MSTPRAQLVTDLASGSLHGYVQKLRRYFAKRAAVREIDDLVQEVFVRLQAASGERSVEHLDRYLFTVAASVLADKARRRTVRQEYAHESLEERHLPAEELSPERVLLDREALERIAAGISELPPRTREVFVLHRFEEMTFSRIAHELGISISMVEKHVMKALQLLHGRLASD